MTITITQNVIPSGVEGYIEIINASTSLSMTIKET